MSGPSPINPYAPGTSPAASFTPQQVTNIVGGVLEDDLNADGNDINNSGVVSYLAATVAALGQTQDVYIAKRTDGKAGSGLATDPLNGSTQPLLDGIFQAFYDAGTQNVNFYLAAGTYLLKGGWDNTWGMLHGWHVKGAGKDKTKLTQVAGTALTGVGAVFMRVGAMSDACSDNISVEDLWIDCAWFRSGPGGDNSRPLANFTAALVYGENGILKNVRATGCGWAVAENFAISTSGGWANDDGSMLGHIPHNALIEGCDVYGCGDNTSPISMYNLAAHGTNPSPTYAHNGRIINCTSVGPDGTNGSTAGPAGYDSGEMTGCDINGDAYGMFYDTFWSKNIHIHHNKVTSRHATGRAILFNTGLAVLDSFIIDHNTLHASTGVGLASFCQNFMVTENEIKPNPSGDTKLYSIFFADQADVFGNTAKNNVIDDGFPYLLGTGNLFRDNHKPGSSVLAIPDTPGNMVGPITVVSADNVTATPIASFQSADGTLATIVTLAGLQAGGTNATANLLLRPKGVATVYLGKIGSELAVDGTGNVYINGSTRVIKNQRMTGWAVATGTVSRATFVSDSVTLPDLAARVKALIDDFHATAGHGLLDN